MPDNYHPITRTLERLTRGVDARTVAVSEGVERAFTGDSGRYKPGQHQQWCTIYTGIDTEYNKLAHSDPQTVHKKWEVDADLIYLNISRYLEAKAQKTSLLQ